MSTGEDANGDTGERGKERQVMFMNPATSVVRPQQSFYPYGSTPPENLMGGVPKDAKRADMLLLGCSDARHALYTLWTLAHECNRERLSVALEDDWKFSKPPRVQGMRTLRFTLNDREPACLARVLLLLQLFLDSKSVLIKACDRNASAKELAAYSERIALCFSAYYNIYVDTSTQAATQNAALRLLECSASPAAWSESRIGAITHIAGTDTLDRLRAMWYIYADTSIAHLKPKASLDMERSNFHQRNVVPRSNLSPAILNGEGPGVAAALAMEWGTEMSGIHHQYQTWGYIDPFGELLNSTSQKIYTMANPVMVATDHQELEFQIHHSCNPLSAFHLDRAFIDFKETEQPDPCQENSVNRPFFNGPPRVTRRGSKVARRKEFSGNPEAAMKRLRSALVASCLEQLSRMCWAVNWAHLEARNATTPNQRFPIVDVRINFIVGDAVDACDAICALSGEGLDASGVARDGEEPCVSLCGLMPSMSLRPFRLHRGDIDGPGRFDLIDSADLSDTLGILNIVTAASPLLKPSPHAILRTDQRRSGLSRKRQCAPEDVAAESVGEPSDNPRGYAFLTEEDWCTTRVHECAILLGVIPVSSIVPAIGHFHAMLESARIAKTNADNINVGDLGQRLRLSWKQPCLMDHHAGTYIGSAERAPMTLHPRMYMTEQGFSIMILPFWLFMTRSLYRQASQCPTIGEGDERQLRVSNYTPASFARLLSHSLRFLKLGRSHALKVIEHLHEFHSTGLFDANVVGQLDVHMHLLALYRREAMSSPDVVQWARNCPWWEEKPSDKGTPVVPLGSPGMCRVVMIASPQAAAIVQHLRNPPLCVVLEVYCENQAVRMLINTLHCCFVQVHRGSGSFSPQDVEGEPWYVVKDRFLRVKETKPDDPEAELMVSFLLASKTLVAASVATDVELELRLLDLAAKDAAPPVVAETLRRAEGVIFRTNLGNRRETAVVFPSKGAGGGMLERWVPQSVKWKNLLLERERSGADGGFGVRRVGKMNRYMVRPGRLELFAPEAPQPAGCSVGGWAKKIHMEETAHFMWTLHTANPAARTLLADKQTVVDINMRPPCSVEIIIDAPKKKDVKGKKKRRTGEDLGKGGIDGGLRYLLVLPFPVVMARLVGAEKDGVHVVIRLQDSLVSSPFINVLQTVGPDGQKISPPLVSNWAFSIRSAHEGRHLVDDFCKPSYDLADRWTSWLDENTLFQDCHVLHVYRTLRRIGLAHLRAEEQPKRPLQKPWHLLYDESRAPFLMLYTNGVVVDESNEALLLDVCLVPAGPPLAELKSNILAMTQRDSSKPAIEHISYNARELWRHMLPMAVERARQSYSHRPSCRYLDSMVNASEDLELCACGAGMDLPSQDISYRLDSGHVLPIPSTIICSMYRAVLPLSLIPSDSLRCNSRDDQTTDRSVCCNRVLPCHLSRFGYTGPPKPRASIGEHVLAAAVSERGGEAMKEEPSGHIFATNGGDANGELLCHVPDEATAAILMKAGLSTMPTSANEWAKFERVQRGLPAEERCANCNKSALPKRCTRCKGIKYCSKACQVKHWSIHKQYCVPMD